MDLLHIGRGKAACATAICGAALLTAGPSATAIGQPQADLSSSVAVAPAAPMAPFITSMAAGADGSVWVGTEDCGVFRLDRATGAIRQFQAADGLGDESVYAVAVDYLGRVWCGTLNHGVSVFNGETWRKYGIDDGPLGARVFDIKCSPADGDVWMATSAGLARYRIDGDSWTYYTRREGLPSDQAQSFAFNAKGDLYVGLQCGGVAIGRVAERFEQWHRCTAPWYFDADQMLPYTATAKGEGLPSNEINDVLVSHDGTVWVATVAGLAWSRDDGVSWQFLRGRDYAARMEGLFAGVPAGWKPPEKAEQAELLPEDYVTCLAEASDGKLWLGFREHGCGRFDPVTLRSLKRAAAGANSPLQKGFIDCLLPLRDGTVVAGAYGNGVLFTGGPPPVTPAAPAMPAESESADAVGDAPAPPLLPKPASPPTIDEMDGVTAFLDAAKPPLSAGSAMYLDEDWATQGDWVGRYGARLALLCAMRSPWGDDSLGYGPDYAAIGFVGPHHRPGDSLRHWIHWIRADDNPHVLYNPELAIRRQASWDDHGESYPAAFEGPDIWALVDVPPGTHRLSLYFYNKDGHEGPNRFRDYLVEIRRYDSPVAVKVLLGRAPESEEGLEPGWRSKDMALAQKQPVLARARVRDFWGGVYKSFVLEGPGPFYVRIARQGSHNTIVSALLLGRLEEPREAEALRVTRVFEFGGVPCAPPPANLGADTNSPAVVCACRLWRATDDATSQPGLESRNDARIAAFRAAGAAGANEKLMANWRWQLRLWSEDDHRQFWDTMMAAWSAVQDRFVVCRSAQWRPYSPNVVPYSLEELEDMDRRHVDWRSLPVRKKKGKGGKQHE